MTTVRVRYWGAAKDAAGRAEEPLEAETLGEALRLVRVRHAASPMFGTVLERSSYLVDGDPVGTRDPAAVPLGEGATVEVLPPFAGG